MKLANPAPHGLFGFAITTWLLSMVNAGLLPGASVPLVLAMAFLIFLALWVTFFLLGLSPILGIAELNTLGGYGGLITALLAFYLGAAEIINAAHGRDVLPIGAGTAVYAPVGHPAE